MDLPRACGEVIERLKKEAEGLRKRHMRGAGEWTPVFKDALAEIGHEHGCQVWANGGSPEPREDQALDFHEWLFDVCWARCQQDWETFQGLALACEIEWGYSERDWKQDFYKLTVAEAGIRLFIFACKKDGKGALDKVQRWSSWRPGQLYLAMVVPDDEEPVSRCWMSEASSKGGS